MDKESLYLPWKFVDLFTAEEAVALVAGAVGVPEDERARRMSPVRRRMEQDHTLGVRTFAHGFLCGPNDTLIDREDFDPPTHQYLLSDRLIELLVATPTTYSALTDLCWKIEKSFENCRFSRDEIVRWLQANELQSAFDFGKHEPDAEASPTSALPDATDLKAQYAAVASNREQRRQFLTELKKTLKSDEKVGNAIGITRQAVAKQLRSSGAADHHKNDPFARTAPR
ncbi:hypothetical protein [Ottowia sp. SB7-C50]|uniref:hypothetical protein n=1 Tax=Ottowia sp. SB7-C50 TaxID=3081231 RepID=UPI00295391E8|nr:hypothetical protein [Ottowia sp. SB7-C50]WOP14576.1 hypothetical protein R0D99_12055 [Ottowia sp. SB7-C50]